MTSLAYLRTMKPGRRRLLIPCLLVALLVVVVVAAGVRRADADAAPVPVVPSQRVSVIHDPRITESSGLAASLVHPGLAYTVNDSGHTAQVFAIDIASGRVVGVTSVVGVSWKDTEAMALQNGKLWVADVGNNEFNRTDQALYEFDEPGPGDHRISPTRYPVVLEGPQANVESIAFLPGRIDLDVKGWPAGYALALTGQLRTDEPNVAHKTSRTTPVFATDATVTRDGRYVLIRNSAEVEVHDAASWQVVHRDAIPVMSTGETITLEPSDRSYLIGSEGSDSPLVRVAFDPSTWPGKPVPWIDVRAQTQDQKPVGLFIWEHRKALAAAAVLSVLGTLSLLVAWSRARRRRRAV
jgi:hypothetical protein